MEKKMFYGEFLRLDGGSVTSDKFFFVAKNFSHF